MHYLSPSFIEAMWVLVVVDLFLVYLFMDYLFNKVMLYALPHGHLE